MNLCEAVCYLCHDGEVDESDQSLRRDCACRGSDAGFVHLACLTGFAASKSMRWDGRDINEFMKPWRDCFNCHQHYQNELGIDIATEFYSFVRREYPDDTQRQVEALCSKLDALDSMFVRLQPVQKRELGVTADVILSLIGRMKEDASPLSTRYSHFEAFAYGTHGKIALDEGTEESARRAVVHLENQLEADEAIGNVDGIATAKSNIAYAKSMYEGENNNEELLTASQELYESRVSTYGEEHEYTIGVGKVYAIYLQRANRGDEARELLTKLLSTSKQVLGPHHSTTLEVELALERDTTHS
jgi:RING-variant domain